MSIMIHYITLESDTWNTFNVHVNNAILCMFIGEDIECSEDEFTCKDGSCIPREKECDRRNDCKDESDEDKSYCKSIDLVICSCINA